MGKIEKAEVLANVSNGGKVTIDTQQPYNVTVGIEGAAAILFHAWKIMAAKFKQDPRSPRKSAADLFKAGIASLTPLAPLGAKDWDYVDRRRVTVQRNGITRERPAMRQGWRAEFEIAVLLPEYIDRALLLDVLQNAGRLIGVGDFRPTFGRFGISKFQ